MKGNKFLVLSIAAPLLITLGLIRLLNSASPVHMALPPHPQRFSSLQNASPITRYVSIEGTDDSNNCAGINNPCATIQHAVDVAQNGDPILISGGVFSIGSGLVPAVVSVSGKSLSFQGGYTTTFTLRDPETWPTIVDGKNSVRGFFISGSGVGPANVRVTIDGLHIRNGRGNGAGGGIYVSEVTLILTGTRIYSNEAAINDYEGKGGGLYAITATLYISGCSFSHNVALQGGWWGKGGGLYLENSEAEIRYSRFYSNIAGNLRGMGYGGGIYLSTCRNCLVAHNVIRSNWAGRGDQTRGKGGGIAVYGGYVVVRDNEIAENIAGQYSAGDWLVQSTGGGLTAIYVDDLVVEKNRFLSNTAALQSSGTRVFSGSGLETWGYTVTIRSNLFQGNVIDRSGRGHGGAICLSAMRAVYLEGNSIISNGMGEEWGLLINSSKGVTIDNNIIAANRAGGIHIYSVKDSLFRHNTLAENGPNGVYLTATERITFINTIVASHTVGITVTKTAQVFLDHTLWYGNGQNTGGSGVITNTNEIVGPPDFVDPARWNYHIGPGSWAIDRGTEAGINTDIDGNNRPWGSGFDIGADEAYWLRLYLPIVLKNYP